MPRMHEFSIIMYDNLIKSMENGKIPSETLKVRRCDDDNGILVLQ